MVGEAPGSTTDSSALILALTSACALPFGPDAEPGRDAGGNEGAVTAGHPLAAEAGLAVLQSGGLAMDAAITAAAVLAVARPHMNGLGGDKTPGSDDGAWSQLDEWFFE